MGKIRIKVSGCMRSMTGAGQFCAIRSYLATAARHGTSALDALIRAAEGHPGSPAPHSSNSRYSPASRTAHTMTAGNG
jgi:transposase